MNYEFSKLLGKTITGFELLQLADYGDECYLKLEFSDGDSIVLEADSGYNTDAAKPRHEYYMLIGITDAEDIDKLHSIGRDRA